jgi:hypothetical protein
MAFTIHEKEILRFAQNDNVDCSLLIANCPDHYIFIANFLEILDRSFRS